MPAPWNPPHPPAAPAARAGSPPAYYVPLPHRLLGTLRDTPLAIGVYALIARVYRATKTPVPLSPADIAAYDPTTSPAAALRALRRLLAAGYLLRAPSGGRRNAYLPTWGLIAGVSRP